MGANVGAIDEGHAEREVALLSQFEQAFPHSLLGPADEQLRRARPGALFGGQAAPLGAFLVAPDDRRDRPPLILGGGLAVRANLFDQRFQDSPGGVHEKQISMFLCHAPNMG